MSLSDREISADIIESCRRGDRDAFRALYEAYKDKVYSICLYVFHGDAAAAGDATQQVFLKLITRIRQFRGDAGFSPWLYRLVVNTCTDGVRHRKVHSIVADSSALEGLGQASSQDADLARSQMASAVQVAVSTLSPEFRIVVLLRYFEDLSYREIAKILDCSMGTVASRLSRGHRILAEKLSPFKDWFAMKE